MSKPSEGYERPLSAKDQEWVPPLFRDTSHVGLKRRCHIILLSAQRYSIPQIASLLISSEDTIAYRIHEFNRSGLEGILPQERIGRPAKITEEFLCCWSKQGQQRKIETPRQNQRQYGAGLIRWVSDKLYWATSDHKNNALFPPSSRGSSSQGLGNRI